MADHQRGADRNKGKELATTSSESSPCWSTYNAHCVRLAIERVAGPGATDITNEEIFYQTVDELQVIVTRKSNIPDIQEELDLHRLFIEVIARGGQQEVEKNGLWREVCDVISPNTAVCDLLDFYNEHLLHYCEDFIAQNNAASRTRLGDAHWWFKPKPPLAQAPFIATKRRRKIPAPQTRSPDKSSSLRKMVDESVSGEAQAITGQQEQQNIVSAPAPCPSSFATRAPLLSSTATASPFPTQGDFGTELLKLQAEVDFLPDWIWNVPVDPQLCLKALTQYTFLAPWLGSYTGMETTPYLDTVANPHLAAAFPELAQYPQGMYPHSPPILSMNSLFFYVYVEAVSKALSQYTFLAPWLDSHAGMDPNPYSEVAELISPARPIEAQIGTKPRLALPEGQVAPTSQRKVGDSSPTDDMANAEKKKLNTAAEELQPSAPSGYNISVKGQRVSSDRPASTPMKAEESGNSKEAEKKPDDNQKAMEDKQRNESMTKMHMQKEKAEIHCNVVIGVKAEGSSENHKPEGEKDVDKDLNMEFFTGAAHGIKGSSGKGNLEGQKTAD
ncbi:hypothetical protein FCV25MIE_29163 [Fagus crenata]